jgi:hypothetical protein
MVEKNIFFFYIKNIYYNTSNLFGIYNENKLIVICFALLIVICFAFHNKLSVVVYRY